VKPVSAYKRSFAKTSITAAAAGLLVIVATRLLAPHTVPLLTWLIDGIGWVIGGLFEAIAAGGVIALYRDHEELKGRRDVFLRSNGALSEQVLTATKRPAFGLLVRRGVRALVRGRWSLAGDHVEVRSLEEIQKTLDANGCLDGLPFMPEMAKFCGQSARVFRCVDKIYDYGRTKKLRRLRHVVLLGGFRCDGSAHGRCQAACYLQWKTAWLKDVPARAPSRGGQHSVPVAQRGHPELVTPAGPARYTCQYTQLAAASQPMNWWDIRQDLRPLLAGNVTVRAFGVAVLTRLFNEVQEARRGTGYPAPWRGLLARSARVAQGVLPGDRVRIRRRDEIGATLDTRGRNRGLWFDDDMIKHCGHVYSVRQRVERIIDDATGQMLEMKGSCILLEGVDASGEFLRLCAQHEYPFWREVWLSPEQKAIPDSAEGSRPVNGAGILETRRSG